MAIKRIKKRNIPLPIIICGLAVEIYTREFYISGNIELVSRIEKKSNRRNFI
ncbi:hypothetical protein SAMN06265182_1922 [Persephonella hydrogeniphila]|uniref:Uncharacterized protein n=1 Tax=Persephonella hydrogeniphila TaxID=198703 RepID=A0A285NMJ9_9AQUI|nr:hypothetical protein SAMN06265182_1922 [Persephonella hydrogeniphila]